MVEMILTTDIRGIVPLTVNILRLQILYPQMFHPFLKLGGPGTVACISYYPGIAKKMQVTTMPQGMFESSC